MSIWSSQRIPPNVPTFSIGDGICSAFITSASQLIANYNEFELHLSESKIKEYLGIFLRKNDCEIGPLNATSKDNRIITFEKVIAEKK